MSNADLPTLVIIGDGSASLCGDGIAPWGSGFSRIEAVTCSTNATCDELISALPAQSETGVILSFDLSAQCDAWFGASREVDLINALQAEAERCTALAKAAHERHPRVAVWGAIPSSLARPGQAQERGVAFLIFAKLLAAKLLSDQIPFLSLTKELLARGEARLSTAMRLHALRLLAHALRTEPSVQEPFEHLVTRYASSEYITEGGWTRLHLTFLGEAQFITHLFVRKEALSRIGYMSVACFDRAEEKQDFGWRLVDAQEHDRQLYRLPVGAYAKTLIVNALAGVVKRDEITVFTRVEDFVQAPIGMTCAA